MVLIINVTKRCTYLGQQIAGIILIFILRMETVSSVKSVDRIFLSTDYTDCTVSFLTQTAQIYAEVMQHRN
jgi:hypothetical protein